MLSVAVGSTVGVDTPSSVDSSVGVQGQGQLLRPTTPLAFAKVGPG